MAVRRMDYTVMSKCPTTGITVVVFRLSAEMVSYEMASTNLVHVTYRLCLTSCPSSGSSVCLPGWKHNSDFTSELGSGAAPDGDVDAIVGMIFALRAVEANGGSAPAWYNEVLEWADASCTAFLKYNTAYHQSYGDRLLKLGSCWGGWYPNGNNPSYHSPGSYKIMRDFHVNYPYSRSYAMPNFEEGDLSATWNNLIDTSHDVIHATKCQDAIGMVPNWAKVTVENNQIVHVNESFSGSNTPQWEFGAEASRTIWRLALDAVVYPDEMNLGAYSNLELLLKQLDSEFSTAFNKSWSDTAVSSTREKYRH